MILLRLSQTCANFGDDGMREMEIRSAQVPECVVEIHQTAVGSFGADGHHADDRQSEGPGDAAAPSFVEDEAGVLSLIPR